jgi:arylformamidase
VTIEAVAGRGLRGHREINRELGNPDYAPIGIVDRWIAALLAS